MSWYHHERQGPRTVTPLHMLCRLCAPQQQICGELQDKSMHRPDRAFPGRLLHSSETHFAMRFWHRVTNVIKASKLPDMRVPFLFSHQHLCQDLIMFPQLELEYHWMPQIPCLLYAYAFAWTSKQHLGASKDFHCASSERVRKHLCVK